MSGKRMLTVGVSALMMYSAAMALPADRVIYFAIHENPENPNSRVQYYLSLSITAADQDGDWIGWDITNYKITEKAVLGSDTVWDVDSPNVGTTDGLWWVEHADPDNPIPTEFVEPAPVADTAVAVDPADPDLDFDVVGVPYTPPPGGPPYQVTAALDFAFSATADPNDPPDDSGDDEPVDNGPPPSPPSPTSQ